MNREAFYAALRRRDSGVFGTSLRQTQVEGMEAILAASAGLPLPCVAYILATAYHETAYTMQPVRETLADTDAKAVSRLENAWKAGRLKWVKTPYWRFDADGKTWLGRGYVQLTHKTNYARAGRELGLDLVGNPGLAMQPTVAALILVRGSMEGWFTGRKLPSYMAGDGFDYVNARAVINGDVKGNGAKIAAEAKAFEAALRAAGWSAKATPMPKAPQPAPEAPQKPVAPAPQSKPRLGIGGAVAALIAALTLALSQWWEQITQIFGG
jgi:predicted chitinase